MEPLTILLHGKACGELLVEQRGLYRQYSAACRIEQDAAPMRLFAVGELGEVRLGVMQPENGRFVLRRQISAKDAAAAGKLLRGELRPLALPGTEWQSLAEPERLFHDTMLQKRLRGRKDVLFYRSGDCCYLAIPFDTNRPFPLTDMFCLSCVRRFGPRQYAVFCFDQQGKPRFF